MPKSLIAIGASATSAPAETQKPEHPFPQDISLEHRKKLARRAKRNLASERSLIATAGFDASAIMLFWFAKITFLPISQALQSSPILTWLGLSAVLTIIWVMLHSVLAGRIIAAARAYEARLRAEHSQKERETQAEKLRQMQDAP